MFHYVAARLKQFSWESRSEIAAGSFLVEHGPTKDLHSLIRIVKSCLSSTESNHVLWLCAAIASGGW